MGVTHRALGALVVAVCACGTGPSGDLSAPPTPRSGTPNPDPTLRDGDGDDAGSRFDTPPKPGPRPDFGETRSLADAPPPISGGTLAVSADGALAVAADPDRDRVYVVDLAKRAVRFDLALAPHDEPGRVAIDGAGRAHVALRRGGDLATIDLATGALARRAACAEPRGVAWDPASDRVHVACATGELVSFDAASGPAVRRVRVERDLRDVLVVKGALFVTTFRKAEVLGLDASGALATRRTPPKAFDGAEPYAAWRTIVRPNGDLWMLHQRTKGALVAVQGGYGGSCRPSIEVVVSVLPALGLAPQPAAPIGDAALGVDLAAGVGPKGARPVVVTPGNAHTPTLANWYLFDLQAPPPFSNCGNGWGGEGPPPDMSGGPGRDQLTAVATGPDGAIVLQSREPARLVLLDPSGGWRDFVDLSSVQREDTGHAIVHANSGAFLACASCHLEGGDDGRVWTIDGKRRRTPSLRGTIAGTAPYHWEGDLPDLPALLGDVYERRMSGGPLDAARAKAVARWLEALPAPRPAAVDPLARDRGAALFEGKAQCATCHAGAKRTDNLAHDVHGGAMQTPSLVGVAARAPFMHDGCAATLLERFTQCDADRHGVTGLSQAEIGDLVTYMESL